MKKLIVVISVVLIAVLFAACSESDNKGSYNGKTESFSNADEAFESMSEAVDSGDYQAALDCYQNGAADADELDLNSIRVGDSLSFTLDAYGSETFAGAVTEICPLGMARQNATYFDVRISLPQGRTLLPGMNATVTLNK